MNTRERFLALMSFESGQRTMLWEMGYWTSTLERWYEEGLPRHYGIPKGLLSGDGIRAEAIGWLYTEPYDRDVHQHFGMDEAMRRIPINNLFYPRFEVEVLEEHADWTLIRDSDGVTKRQLNDRGSLPDFVSWPVHSREDWERLKAERLQPTLEGRLPRNWHQLLAEFRQRDYPLAIGGSVGFFGTPRALMGPEGLLTGYYDDPELVKDVVDDLADFWIALYGQVLDQVDADLGLIWEDMSYKGGSLISPATFRRFMMPAYQKLTGFWRERGVRMVWVDTDGDCSGLIPLLMEGGVTGVYPMEVRAGMDVTRVRRAFPRLQIMGGIDKTQIAAGPKAIDEELEAKVPFMLRQGGFIPYVDHYVHPEVSLADFSYYRRRLAEMADSA